MSFRPTLASGSSPFLPRAILGSLAAAAIGASTPGQCWEERDPCEEFGSIALLSGGAGIKDDDVFVELGLEYRFPEWTHDLQPILGATWIDGGGFYAYGGLRYELDLSPRFYVAPSFAAGLYDDNDAIDLGGAVEFRSMLEVGFRASEYLAFGASVYHLSNAGLYEQNGGSESLVLSVSVDLARVLE